MFLHLAPLVTIAALNTNFYLLNATQKVQLYENATQLIPRLFSGRWFLGLGVFIYVGSYLGFSFRMLTKQLNRNNLTLNYRNTLGWLKRISGGYIIFWSVLLILSQAAIIYGQRDFLEMIASWSLAGFTTFIIALTFTGLRQTILFSGAVLEAGRLARRYDRSGLSDQQAREYAEKLLRFTQTEKPYLKKTGLKEVAHQLEISENHLSQVLNERIGMRFSDFLNSYRVKEFQNEVRKPSNKHLTLFGLAQLCGFNSKATFQSTFKKFVGETPSQFHKRTWSDPLG